MHSHLGLKHKMIRRKTSVTRQHVRYIKILDKVTLVAGVVGPFTVLPQIYQIFTTHDASGVSALSWALLFLVTAPWILYGMAHKDKAIIASFILWEVANALVFIGALMYG